MMFHPAPALGLALDWVAAGLVRASTYGALSVGAVWLVCRLAPRLPASARALLWWCAALKLLVDFTGLSPIPLPVLPGPAVASSTAAVASAAANGLLPDAVKASGTPDGTPPVASARGEIPARSFAARPAAIVATLWIAGLAAIGYRMIRRIRRTMEVVKRSTSAPGTVAAVGAALAARLGLRTTPRLRVSAEVPTPFVSGLGRLTVVLPARLVEGLPEHELRMALCHELAHVRRSDTRLGCVPAFAECLLFYHPLAHLAAREYALGREAACDAIVLSVVGAAPREYGRLLLGLGVSRLDAGVAAAGASCSFSNLKRRIAMLRDPQAVSIRTRLVAAGAAAAAVLALAPVQLVARTSPEQATSVEAAAPAGLVPVEPAALGQAPRKAEPERTVSYVFFKENDESTTVSGSSQDIEHARQYRKAGERLLWFRLSGKEYVVRDPALLRQFEDIWRPVGEIGAEEGKLGARQGQLGAKQGDLGRKQGEIGAQQGALGARQGSLGAKQGELASREAGHSLSAAEKADIEKQRQYIDQQMRELDVQMKQLDEKMRAFDQPMRELGKQMEALGKEMEALGRKMNDASDKAEADTKSLLDRAVAGGLAQPVK